MSDAAQVITVTLGGKTFRTGKRTAAHIQWTIDRLAKKHPGARLVIIQGTYNVGVKASAGTHDKDACLDVAIVGLGWWDAQRFLRECGWAAWYRFPPAFGHHIHMISLGCPGPLGVFVPAQIDDYKRHALGLKGQHNSGADKSWFPPNIAATNFDYPAWLEENEDMKPSEIADAPITLQRGADNKPWPTTVQGAFVELENTQDDIQARLKRIEALLTEAVKSGK